MLLSGLSAGFGRTDSTLLGTQVELDSLSVGVVEPDVLLLAVRVDCDAAVLDVGGVELGGDGFELGERGDGEGEVIEADLVLVEGRGLGLGDGGEEERVAPTS